MSDTTPVPADDLAARVAALEAALLPHLDQLNQLAGPVVTAVAPIAVGELNDVPTPGSPIASQWAQEVSGRIVHRFNDVATRNSRFAPGPNKGAVCVTLDTMSYWYSDGTAWLALNEGRKGITRGATANTLNAGITTTMTWVTSGGDPDGFGTSATDVTIPAGLGSTYAISLSLVTSPAPSAIVIPSLVVATVQYNAAAVASSTHAMAMVVPIAAGNVIQVKVYNGGSNVSAAASLWVYKVGP